MGEFRALCAKERANELKWPARDYVRNDSRVDNIRLFVIRSSKLLALTPRKASLVSLILTTSSASFFKAKSMMIRLRSCSSVGMVLSMIQVSSSSNGCSQLSDFDLDASLIYDQTIEQIHSEPWSKYSKDVVAMRLPPSDQRTFKHLVLKHEKAKAYNVLSVLNALMQNSKIALQLSTREGFEVKVSEALHTGKPVVASRTGGIPLQIQDGKSGFLCNPGDNDTVAKHLFNLYTDKTLYETMSEYARSHVSDEVGTVGNAAAWLYLAAVLTRGTKLKPNGAWLNDMLREEAGEPYLPGEPKLPREGLDVHA